MGAITLKHATVRSARSTPPTWGVWGSRGPTWWDPEAETRKPHRFFRMEFFTELQTGASHSRWRPKPVGSFGDSTQPSTLPLQLRGQTAAYAAAYSTGGSRSTKAR